MRAKQNNLLFFMPNASTFDEVKGTDKRGQFKRKTIFSFYCRVKVPSIKVRISERKAKFIWTFPNRSTFSVAKGTDTLGDWLCPKGVPVPVFSSQILNPHCGLVPLIPGWPGISCENGLSLCSSLCFGREK